VTQNVFLISLVGISVVFSFLIFLFVIMKLFKYFSMDKENKKQNVKDDLGNKKNQASQNVQEEEEIAAIITSLASKDHFNGGRIYINKRR